jgi:S-DNA-T family DNA segregation ATPase FtsK/SpoIIIE
MERSNKAVKAGIAAGAVFLLLAAFFSISLILQALDFGASGPGRSTIFFSLGEMLVSVYGFSSIFIPVFLFCAAIACFSSEWTKRKALLFITAVIPFFTAVITENICRSIAESGSFVGIKIGITLLIGILLIIIEFLGTGIIADRTAHSTPAQKKDIENESADDELPLDEVYSDNIIELDGDELRKTETPAAEENHFENVFSYEENTKDDNSNKKETTDSDKSDTEDAEDEAASDTPASAVTAEEIEALISPDKSSAEQSSGTAEELQWPEIPTLEEDKTAEDAEYLGSFSDHEQQKIDEMLKAQNAGEKTSEEPAADDTEPENESEENSADETASEEETAPEAKESLIPKHTAEVIAQAAAAEQAAKNAAASSPITVAAVARDVFDRMDSDIRGTVTPEEPVPADAPADKDKEDLVKFFDAAEDTVQPAAPAAAEETAAASVSVPPAEPASVPAPADVTAAAPAAESATLDPQHPKIAPQKDISQVIAPAEKPVQEKKTPKMKGPYAIPTKLLTAYQNDKYWIIDDETKQASVQLKETLNEFNIEADVTGIKKGPVVTMFEILPAPGVKLSKIAALQDNIALRLAASSVRIVAPIPGKRAVGIEIPNKERSIVSFREIIEQDLPEYKKMAVPVILGKDILGKPQLLDLVKTPHLLIAGATGSGKSVCVNSMILSILYKRSPQEVKLILIDPKIVELKLYNDIPHLLTPVITETKKALQSLQWALCEMERRYALLDGMGCRDISSYNKRIEERKICTEKLPYIVIIIDEFADLMATSGKELESTVARLAAMSRAVGIHLVLATQRPSIDVITGLIKANIPSRIAFMVASKMDSRIIIDQVGAEKLLGKGDMLYSSAVDPYPVRIQGTFVSDEEVENVVEYVKKFGEPEYIDDEIFVEDDDDENAEPSLFDDGEDPLYNQALEIVVQAGKASASYIQRRLKIGYNRAARLVEEMEDRGIVGPQNGSKPREIIHVP